MQPAAVLAPKTGITQNHFKNMKEAEANWARRRRDIKAGKKDSMLTLLEKRGYINQIVGKREDLDRLMTEKRVGIYCGIDPTAPSLHVGHLLPLMVLFWTYIYCYRSCSLIGGATGRIGDPTDRMTRRDAVGSKATSNNGNNIKNLLKTIWSRAETAAAGYGYEREWAWRRQVVNNNEWLNKLSVMEFLHGVGQTARIGPMLGRDTVKNRIEKGDGMSFAEFTYPLLQSWDWWHMYKSPNAIQLQIGGSDQFGNIVAGVDTINNFRQNYYDSGVREELKKRDHEDFLGRPMGFTVPLLTTASGQKFGKSEGNAIWLDMNMTSSFDLYGFFLKTSDADVHRYLKLFTFEPLEALEALMEEHGKDPSKRVAQHKLAFSVLSIVHTKSLALDAEKAHRSLFQKPTGAVSSVSATDDPQQAQEGTSVFNIGSIPSQEIILPRSLVFDNSIFRIIYHAGIVPSLGEGRRRVAAKGVYLGTRPVATGTTDSQVEFVTPTRFDGDETAKYILGGDTLIVRMGKSNIKLIKVISDKEYERQGHTAPYLKGKNNTGSGVEETNL